jgi:hypothetical protein
MENRSVCIDGPESSESVLGHGLFCRNGERSSNLNGQGGCHKSNPEKAPEKEAAMVKVMIQKHLCVADGHAIIKVFVSMPGLKREEKEGPEEGCSKEAGAASEATPAGGGGQADS